MRLRAVVAVETRLRNRTLTLSQERRAEREGGKEEEDHQRHDQGRNGLDLDGGNCQWIRYAICWPKTVTYQEEELPPSQEGRLEANETERQETL